ncbi:MAG: LacI family DNA-binding transcriptional regulator, partial [Acetanaerobacterium sp.]
MATIKDIAREAGVSYTTVSNVIHGRSSRVSPEMINRISEIIKRLDYTPNMSARALVSSSSKVVGMINHLIPKASGSFVEDPFHSAFIGSIEEVLRENGYYLMLRTVDDRNDLISFLKNWNVDGMFFTGLFEDEFFQTLQTVDIPVVLIDSYIDYPRIQNVGLEDYNGGYLAAKHLIDNGHTNILFASPTIHPHGVVNERLQGFKKALADNGIPFHPEYVFEQEITVGKGIALGKRLSRIPGITAVF